jgi:hypothetical protein
MLAKTMSDMVNTVLMPLVGFGTTVYWLVGLRASFEAFATYLVIFATMLTVCSLPHTIYGVYLVSF